jgi:excisionase family DNA binding protein
MGVHERTVLPPRSDAGDVRSFQEIVDRLGAHGELQPPELVLSDGSRLLIPEPLAEVLREVAQSLAEGHAVTVVPRHTTLTTQQAAEFLGISRPTFVKLLEDGALPFTQPGRHRRIRLDDVLAYRSRVRQARSEALDELAALSEDMDLYADGVSSTRLRR